MMPRPDDAFETLGFIFIAAIFFSAGVLIVWAIL